MTQLYALTKELATIHNQIIDAEGEITPELEAKLTAIKIPFEDKVKSISTWTLDLDGDVEKIDKEIARLQKHKQVTNNLATRLKEYVKKNMEAAEITKIKSPTLTVSIAASPASVEIYAETLLPPKFIVTEVNYIPDKKAIKAALQSGEVVEGAKLITDKTHLRIK
jgi:hypothetical protein